MPSIKILNTNIFPIITDGVYILNHSSYNNNDKTYDNTFYKLYSTSTL